MRRVITETTPLGKFIGAGYYRSVFEGTPGKTVIKQGCRGGDPNNLAEYGFYNYNSDLRGKFTYNGKKFKVRLAKVIDCRNDGLLLEMEYVPNVGKIHEIAGVNVCYSCSGNEASKCEWDECFACLFNEWCDGEFGIDDVHMNNFGYLPGRREIVIVDYAGSAHETY